MNTIKLSITDSELFPVEILSNDMQGCAIANHSLLHNILAFLFDKDDIT